MREFGIGKKCTKKLTETRVSMAYAGFTTTMLLLQSLYNLQKETRRFSAFTFHRTFFSAVFPLERITKPGLLSL